MKSRGIAAPPWSDLPRPILVTSRQPGCNDHQEELNDTFVRALEQVESIHTAGEAARPAKSRRQCSGLATLMVAQAREHQHSGNLAAAWQVTDTAMHVCDMLRPHGDSVDWCMAADS